MLYDGINERLFVTNSEKENNLVKISLKGKSVLNDNWYMYVGF